MSSPKVDGLASIGLVFDAFNVAEGVQAANPLPQGMQDERIKDVGGILQAARGQPVLRPQSPFYHPQSANQAVANAAAPVLQPAAVPDPFPPIPGPMEFWGSNQSDRSVQSEESQEAGERSRAASFSSEHELESEDEGVVLKPWNRCAIPEHHADVRADTGRREMVKRGVIKGNQWPQKGEG